MKKSIFKQLCSMRHCARNAMMHVLQPKENFQSLEDSVDERGSVGCRESSSKIIPLELSSKNMSYSI